MGRESTITSDQVNAIANTIKAEGGKPTSRGIRERLGNTGSMGTINKLLQKWKGDQKRATTGVLSLPVTLQNAILDFMDHELTVARASLETEVAEYQQEAADLATENERQADAVEELSLQVSALAGEKASIEGKADQLSADLITAHQDAAAERQAAEHARTELAKALLRLEAMPRMEQDLESARVDLATERDRRVNAEREAAVLRAQKEDSDERQKFAEAEVRRLRDELGALAEAHRTEVEIQAAAMLADLTRIREESSAELKRQREENQVRVKEAREDAARAGDLANRMQERVDAITAELNRANAQAKSAGEEAAELRGRMNGLQDNESAAPAIDSTPAKATSSKKK